MKEEPKRGKIKPLDAFEVESGAETTIKISVNSEVLEKIKVIAAAEGRIPKEEINLALRERLRTYQGKI